MKRLADARVVLHSLDDARMTMQHIAELTCQIKAEEAKVEKKIVSIKADLAARTQTAREELANFEEQLSDFILANKPQFQKPRKVKTEFGEFGLQTSTELVVTDEDSLLQELMERGYSDCQRVKRDINKKALVARIEDGESFPGALIKSGDTAVYKVAQHLVKEAVGEVQ